MPIKQRAWDAVDAIRRVPKRVWIITGASAVGLIVVAQLLYPTDRLLPLDSIDGLVLGWTTKAEAVTKLDQAYAAKRINVYLGQNSKAVSQPTLAEAGITINNAGRVGKKDYPWYLRLIPTSVFWANAFSASSPMATMSAKTDTYITSTLLPSCTFAAQNATLQAQGAALKVVPAKPGAECDPTAAAKEFKAVKPVLNVASELHVSVKTLPAEVTDVEAQASATSIMSRVGDGVPLSVNNETLTIPASDFLSWLTFTPAGERVNASVNAEKAGDYLTKNAGTKVAIAAGTATVTTLDFSEISRTGGGDGRALSLDGTVASLNGFLTGTADMATVATQVVPATIKYIRTYSSTDEGINALFANFAKDHPGTYGVSYAELYGSRRHASYNGDKQFVTASTYKLFAAYSVLKRVEAGSMSWDDNQDCFNKMISKSDNACAEGFLSTVGLKNITDDIHGLGLNNSTFMTAGGPYTTANDLVTYLGTLESGSMFSATNKDRLVSAMKSNVYRQGIPAGASGQVADKVGFLDGLLHDAAIVYSPKGTYVLAVMTNGSTWANIVELTRQLENIR